MLREKIVTSYRPARTARRLLRVASAFSLAGCIAACGSSSAGSGGGSTAIAATIGAQSISLQNAVGVSGSLPENGATVYETDVFVANLSGACGLLQQNANPSNGVLLSIGIGGEAPVGSGTYAVTATGNVRVSYVAQDVNCNVTVNEAAQGGTVTYDAVNSTAITGSIDVTFSSGDHVTGEFSAPICNVDLSALATQSSGSTTGCMHDW
jgi:hypothetical protein